jgi:hypothetical protein
MHSLPIRTMAAHIHRPPFPATHPHISGLHQSLAALQYDLPISYLHQAAKRCLTLTIHLHWPTHPSLPRHDLILFFASQESTYQKILFSRQLNPVGIQEANHR